MLRDFSQIRNIRRAFLDNDFTIENVWFMSMGVVLRADVTVSLCSMIRILSCQTGISLSGFCYQ